MVKKFGKLNVPDYVEYRIEKMLRYLGLGYPLEFVYFPSTGVSSTLEHLEHLGDKTGYEVFLIDLLQLQLDKSKQKIAKDFYDLVVRTLLSKCGVLDLDISGLSDFEDIFEISNLVIKKLIEQEKHVLFVFLHTDISGVKAMPEFNDYIQFLEKKRNQYAGKSNFVLCSYSRVYRKHEIVGIKGVYFDYSQDPSLESGISSMIKEMGFEDDNLINSKTQMLLKISGGMVFIAKSILRDLVVLDRDLDYLISKKEYDVSFFDEFSILKFKLDRIANFLNPEEFSALVKKAMGESLSKEKKELLEPFYNFGIFDKSGNFKSLVLSSYLRTHKSSVPNKIESSTSTIASGTIESNKIIAVSSSVYLDTNSFEILENGKQTGVYLSENENSVLQHFIKNRGKAVLREDIARILWGENMNIQYSDWAIDRTIYRLRKKIQDKSPYQIILTLKKRGFIIK
jgi:DNA-binding winged helix-turn-helix (wHTH) protein